MNRAFIFDMDGVLMDTEHIWVKYDHVLLNEFAGPKIADQLGSTVGWSIHLIYDKAVALGASFSKDAFIQRYEELAPHVYAEAPVTAEVEPLITLLIERGYRIGLVSTSRRSWIDYALPKFPFGGAFETIISLNDSLSLQPKPSPDGYIQAFRVLAADPAQSIILEDSNPGIASGKAAGAYVIGFKQHLIADYQQTGADVYADTMNDVIKLVESSDGH